MADEYYRISKRLAEESLMKCLFTELGVSLRYRKRWWNTLGLAITEGLYLPNPQLDKGRKP